MVTQTTVWAALAVSQQVQFAIPYIDPSSLQPNIDGGVLAGLPTGGGFCYVPSPYNVNPAFAGMGALQVGTAGDNSGVDPINAGGQFDSYVPSTIQAPGTVGGIPGHTVSVSGGTRYLPSVIVDAMVAGEFASYGYVSIAGVKSYQRLAAMTAYVQGADANYPGGELRWGTKANGGLTYTDWSKLSNAGLYQLAGYFTPPLLPATATFGAFQAVSQLWVTTGVPNNLAGSNGDFALRSDGGAGTCIYQKRAGAWVATGA